MEIFRDLHRLAHTVNQGVCEVKEGSNACCDGSGVEDKRGLVVIHSKLDEVKQIKVSNTHVMCN